MGRDLIGTASLLLIGFGPLIILFFRFDIVEGGGLFTICCVENSGL